jgi:transposase
MNGIYWRSRTGSPWPDIPKRYGAPTACAKQFRRWAKIGVWDRIFEAVSKAYEGDLQMIDASSIRVHQQGGNVTKGAAGHANYLALVRLASTRIWLRHNESVTQSHRRLGCAAREMSDRVVRLQRAIRVAFLR